MNMLAVAPKLSLSEWRLIWACATQWSQPEALISKAFDGTDGIPYNQLLLVDKDKIIKALKRRMKRYPYDTPQEIRLLAKLERPNEHPGIGSSSDPP